MLIYLLKFFQKRPIFRNRDIDGLSSANEKVLNGGRFPKFVSNGDCENVWRCEEHRFILDFQKIAFGTPFREETLGLR